MDPILIPIRSGRMMFLGILAGVCATVLTVTSVALWWVGSHEGDLPVVPLIVCVCIIACAVHYIGLAIHKPVALRMDTHGISGYYAEPSQWIEIMDIDVFSGRKGARYLGFAFLNPDLFGARQSWFRRFITWSISPMNRYQIVIPETALHSTEVEYVAAQARAFRRAA